MPPAKAKQIVCVHCDITLVFHHDHGYYKCPDCGGEWWPGPTDYDVATLWKEEQRYKKSMSKLGGGSRQTGRRNPKKDAKKRTATERFQLE